MSNPLTPEREAEIRADVATMYPGALSTKMFVDLLAVIDATRAELDAARRDTTQIARQREDEIRRGDREAARAMHYEIRLAEAERLLRMAENTDATRTKRANAFWREVDAFLANSAPREAERERRAEVEGARRIMSGLRERLADAERLLRNVELQSLSCENCATYAGDAVLVAVRAFLANTDLPHVPQAPAPDRAARMEAAPRKIIRVATEPPRGTEPPWIDRLNLAVREARSTLDSPAPDPRSRYDTLDKPDDRLYHAADRTWWRRDADGALKAAEAPPEVEEMRATLERLVESSWMLTNAVREVHGGQGAATHERLIDRTLTCECRQGDARELLARMPKRK